MKEKTISASNEVQTHLGTGHEIHHQDARNGRISEDKNDISMKRNVF
jgi:hypothetical protein